MTLEHWLASFSAAFAHRLRAMLTLLGVAIGAGAIVLLASLLHGGQRALMMADQEASDDDIVEVHRDDPPPAEYARTARPLGRVDADTLARARGVDGALVAPESAFDAWARFEGRRKRVAIVSAGPATLSLYRLSLQRGRALDEDDGTAARRVAVIGAEVYSELAQSAPLDRLRLEVDGELFAVVGVLAKKPMLGSTDSTYLWDRKVLIPEKTYDALYAPAHDVHRIYVRRPGLDQESRARLRAIVHLLVLDRHFGVSNFALAKDESAGTEQLILGSIQVLLLGTGLIALIAAGINIMNVMLVTVSERRREIGLRRALGATRRSILLQFLTEAAGLASVGGALGVLGGGLLAAAVALLAHHAIGAWAFALPPWSIAAGLALALGTGVAFGLLPAWRAARVSPIEALRNE